MAEAEYISKEAALACFHDWIDRYGHEHSADEMTEYQRIEELPAANVVQEENILKFYYVRSIDEYWIGRRLDNLYYARYESENQQWVWAYSRYLPWGEHVVSPTSLWKEHTYPSEPEEISFTDWLQGFAKQHIVADAVEVVRCKDCIHAPLPGDCEGNDMEWPKIDGIYEDCTCPHCCADNWYSTRPDPEGFCEKGERRGPNLDTTKGERRDESSG